LTDEGAAAGTRLDDAEELERPQRFADRRPRDLELLGQLALGGKLIAGTQIAFLQKTLDLLDNPLVKAAPPDRLDDGQGLPPALVRWSDQTNGG